MVKKKILEILRNNEGYLSGEELSRDYGISRTAIWKHIGSLRRSGYIIEAFPRKGYKLKKIPDLLLPQELERVLKNKIIGKKVIHYESTESTINIAKNIKKTGNGDGTVIVAEKQTAGKGRFGRQWISTKGGIWLSVILLPKLDPVEAPKLNIVAAMSVIDALESIGLKPEIKWPNDVLINGKKIAGILIHLNAELDRINYMIVSIGINANNNIGKNEPALKNATTIKKELGKKIRRIDFTASILAELEKNYCKLFDNHFAGLLEEWKKRCVTINKTVSVNTVSGEYKGIAKDIDEYGRLLLITDDGDKKLLSSGEATILK